MKKSKIWARVFAILALALSHMMCAVTAYQFCALQWAGQYAGAGAPPEAALLTAVPYALGVVSCVLLARHFGKRREAA